MCQRRVGGIRGVLGSVRRAARVALEPHPVHGSRRRRRRATDAAVAHRSHAPSYTAAHGASAPAPATDVHSPLGMVNVGLYSAIITRVSNALNTLVSGEKPGFQALSKGLVVLLCAEVVRQGVPDHGPVHSECSASNSG